MRKFAKIFGVTVALVVVVAVVLLVLAKLLITPERVRTTVIPMAEKALHRQVQLGDVEVSLFSGITLKNLVIEERQGGDPFVAADSVVLRYQLWPLLFMHVVIDEVRLDAPKIRIERYADGKFNFSDLMGAPAAPPSATPTASPSSSAGSGTPIKLLVSQVVVKNGELIYRDHAIPAPAPYRYHVTGLQVQASDISLNKPFPFKVQAQINDASLALEGEGNLSDLSGKVKIQMKGLDATAFAPYYQNLLPGQLGSLKVSLDLTAEGNAKALASSGTVNLDQLDLALAAFKDAPLRNASLALTYDVKADLAAGDLQINSAKIVFNKIPVTLAGTVNHFKANPSVDLTVGLPSVDLRSAIDAFPPKLVTPVAGMDLAGTVDATCHLSGSLANPRQLLKDAQLKMNSVQATAGGVRPALNGTLNLQGDTLHSEGLTLKVGDSQAAIDLKAGNLYGQPVSITSAITADKILLDPLLKSAAAPQAASPSAGTVKPAVPAKPTPPPKPVELGPFHLPLAVDGTVNIAQLVYRGLPIEKLAMAYQLRNNVLTLSKLTAAIAGGTVQDTARVDLGLRGLAYKTSLQVRGMQADSLVTALMPTAKGTIFGTLDLNADLNGKGTIAESVKRHLSGQGNFAIRDGKVTGAGLAEGLAGFLNVDELKVINFDQAKGDFKIANGNVRVDGHFDGPSVRLAPKGDIGLDGRLAIALDAQLSPELTKKIDRQGQFSQLFAGTQGWSQIPLKVAGTLSAPRFTLDAKAVRSKVKEKVQKHLERTLEKSLLNKKNGSGDQQQLEKALKGFFGK